MNKQSLEQWISQLDAEGYCDISDKQVEALIRGFAALETQRDELLAALVSLAAVARRYLPDYDEHPEVQKADDAIASVKGGAA